MHSKSAPRRRHSAELKTNVLAACDEPGASISGVALAHGLNANLVRKGRSGRGVKRAGVTVAPLHVNATPKRPASTTSLLLGTSPEFVAIEMPESLKPAVPSVAAAQRAGGVQSAEPLIHVELRRGALHLNVRWPTSASDDCTAWLRELSVGLLK